MEIVYYMTAMKGVVSRAHVCDSMENFHNNISHQGDSYEDTPLFIYRYMAVVYHTATSLLVA